jgi:ABC-type polysaccharide/polyol phosphate export permease
VGCHTGFDSNFYANQLTFAVFFDTGIATARVICKIFAVYLQICIVHSTPGSCFISLNKTLSEKCVADTCSGGFVCARFKTRCRDLQFPMQCFLRTPFMLINVIFASTGRQTKYTLQQIIGAKNQFFTQHSDSKMNFKILHSLLFLLHSEFNWN